MQCKPSTVYYRLTIDNALSHALFPLPVAWQISGQLDDMDSSFAFTSPPGHATSSNAVSLESLNYPGHYLAVKVLS